MAFIIRRTRANGDARYDVRTRIDGRVVTKTFARRKDADAYVAKIESDKLRGVAVDPRRAKVTVREYMEGWLAARSDLAVRSRELYAWLAAKKVFPALGDVEIGKLTPAAVRAWHAEMARTTPTTAAKAYRLLSTVMRTAVADEVIGRNPCQVRGASVEKAPERPVVTVAQIAALADAMPEHLHAVVLLAAWCQLRRGEIAGLRRKDVDLLHSTVTVAVTRTLTMAGAVVEKGPKSEAGRRTLVMPPHVREALSLHLTCHVAPGPEALVFDVTARALDVAWQRARVRFGMPQLHLHDLRHSGLTLAAASGATIAELMHRAGHASPAAALRYQHATVERDRVLASALGDLVIPAPVVPLAATTPGSAS